MTEDRNNNLPREMNRIERCLSKISIFITRFRRKYIPHLVWYGQEIDVLVTWKENRLSRNTSPENALKVLNSGHLFQIERMFSEIGVEFDRGVGFGGRDWEWDWSLRGPISVTFTSKAKKPELRK